MTKRLFVLFSLMCVFALVSVACAGDEDAAQEGVEDVVEEVVEEGEEAAAEVVEDVMEEAEERGPYDVMGFDEAVGDALVIGQGQEPDTLYLYGGSMLAGSHIQNSLYDGPIEGLTYDYQPVIFEVLPKIEDEGSGAMLEQVSIEEGMQYVDPESQEVVTATEAVDGLDQLTVQWTIRDNVTWDDGTPVAAEDSVFSQALACDPDSPTSKFTCDRTEHYIALDEHTVEWKGLPGFTDQTYFTNFYTPLPRHQESVDGVRFDEMAAADVLEDENFTRKPMSFGPFRLKEWVAGEAITLERNEYYWRKDEGLPILNEVIHKFIPDSNSLLAALKVGEIDVATQDGLDISQIEAMDAAMEAGEITPYYVVGTVWEHIDFNLDPVDDRPAIGACKDVRKALAYGTDRETMVEVIQKGKTRVQHTWVPEEHWAYPPDDMMVKYDYDAEFAAQMLQDLGFEDTDGDGIREAVEDITCEIVVDLEGTVKEQVIAAGEVLEFTLNTTAGNSMREETTLLFQQNMADIGVGITLEYMPANVFFEDGPEGPLFGRRFDLGEFAWLTGVQPPVSLYWCTQIPSEENNWGGQNETGWCDVEYDRLGKKADTTLKRAEALPLYHEAQLIFTDNLPVMPLFARVKVMATRPDVVNFHPNPTVNSETWNIETWGFEK